jgi:hypothetical protein
MQVVPEMVRMMTAMVVLALLVLVLVVVVLALLVLVLVVVLLLVKAMAAKVGLLLLLVPTQPQLGSLRWSAEVVVVMSATVAATLCVDVCSLDCWRRWYTRSPNRRCAEPCDVTWRWCGGGCCSGRMSAGTRVCVCTTVT